MYYTLHIEYTQNNRWIQIIEVKKYTTHSNTYINTYTGANVAVFCHYNM